MRLTHLPFIAATVARPPKKAHQGKQQQRSATTMISVDPRLAELEQQLRAANAEIRRLKDKLGEIT